MVVVVIKERVKERRKDFLLLLFAERGGEKRGGEMWRRWRRMEKKDEEIKQKEMDEGSFLLCVVSAVVFCHKNRGLSVAIKKMFATHAHHPVRASFSVVRASAASSRRRRSSSSSSSLTFYRNNRNQSKKTATNFLLLRDTKRSLIVSKAIEVEDEDDNDAEVVEEEEEKSDDDSSALKESQFTSYFAQLMENSDNDVDVLAKFQTEVMALEKSVKDMEAQVQGEQDQKAAIQDQYLRSVADFQNFQKRTAKEKADLAPAVKSKMVEAMLPVLDNFDLTAKNVKGENEGEEKIIKGYQLLHKQLLETLEAEGLKVVPGEGEPFDPNVHEAIMREESEDVAEDHIMEEFRKGYLVGEKLVRASMVKVSSGKP